MVLVVLWAANLLSPLFYGQPVYYWLALVALSPLLPWVVVRARSYNLRNSWTRNIAFGFDGGYGDAALPAGPSRLSSNTLKQSFNAPRSSSPASTPSSKTAQVDGKGACCTLCAATIEGGKKVRETAIYGMFGALVNITDGRYVYMRGSAGGDAPRNQYTLRREQALDDNLAPPKQYERLAPSPP